MIARVILTSVPWIVEYEIWFSCSNWFSASVSQFRLYRLIDVYNILIHWWLIWSTGDVLIQISETQRKVTAEVEGVVRDIFTFSILHNEYNLYLIPNQLRGLENESGVINDRITCFVCSCSSAGSTWRCYRPWIRTSGSMRSTSAWVLA